MTIRLGNKIISGGGSSGVPGWTGTLAEYNALTEIDDEMLYYITDDCLDSNSNHLGGLDIGDIGFTALGVNEELNCRRYLNGQVLAMDEFPEFTSKLKHAVSLNSSIAVDEDVWQTELAMSANGICYKFVIDDNNMTIRLPKYPEYFIAGLSDSTGVAGNGNILGLTDGSGYGGLYFASASAGAGVHTVSPIPLEVGVVPSSTGNFATKVYLGVSSDPSKSGIEALVDSASEKVYGFYFIQVANGLEQTVDITREITLNNPFFLGMYQYFEVEPNNISWLKSEGQWNSAEVYPGMWEWLLEQYNRGLKQTYWWHDGDGWIALTLKETPEVGDPVYGALGTAYGRVTAYDSAANTITLSTDGGDAVTIPRSASRDIVRWVEDEESVIRVTAASDLALPYDLDHWFIINTEDSTFRLPIKVKGAAGKAVVGNGTGLGLISSDNTVYYATNLNTPAGGVLYARGGSAILGNTTERTGVPKGTVGVSTDPNYSGIETSTEGLHLYFYVGEAIQDPTLINVGRITHALSLKTDMRQAAHAAMPSGKYVDMTLGATGTTYIAPANGWFMLSKVAGSDWYYTNIVILIDGVATNHLLGSFSDAYRTSLCNNLIPVKKGDIVEVTYNATGATQMFRFIYAEGSK